MAQHDHDLYIVAEDPELLRQMRDLLETAGMSVATALTEVDAIDELSSYHADDLPCVVIIDLIAGISIGLDLISRIRSVWATLPIIALSTDQDAFFMARRAGANTFLPKPFNIDDLLYTVQSQCSVMQKG
jgi:DNA-binding response OmpR family regulator